MSSNFQSVLSEIFAQPHIDLEIHSANLDSVSRKWYFLPSLWKCMPFLTVKPNLFWISIYPNYIGSVLYCQAPWVIGWQETRSRAHLSLRVVAWYLILSPNSCSMNSRWYRNIRSEYQSTHKSVTIFKRWFWILWAKDMGTMWGAVTQGCTLWLITLLVPRGSHSTLW